MMGLLFPLIAFGQPALPAPKTVWDGVYNHAQEERGQSAYALFCSRCHGEDLNGARGVLRGSRFMDRWREDNLSSLFTLMKNTMPPGPREGVNSPEYVDIIAYVLGVNQFPAGSGELTLNDLERILIVGKDGPKPVPDFALVTVVGCLAPPANSRWSLRNASEPVRTRNPVESTAAELTAAAARPGGAHTFGLLDTVNFSGELRAGRWMEAKGFLMRSPGDDRINLTWLHTLRDTCDAPGAR
jgi:mono/diheme cytochrome c family protein